MKVRATIRTEFPALNLVLEEGQVTDIPGVGTPEGRALYAASFGKAIKDVTEADEKQLCDALLANPNVVRVDEGAPQQTKPSRKETKETEE